MAYTFGAGVIGFGAHTGWNLQSLSISKNKSVARVLGNTGTEAAINAYNEMQEVSSTYKCSANTNTVPASLGAVVSDHVLTSIEITAVPDDYVTMVLTGHKHNDSTPDAPAMEVTHGVTVPSAFGITVASEAISSPVETFTSMTTANAGADYTSITIRISCEHAEAGGSAGTTVAHENYDAKIELTINALSAITAPTGYTVTAQTAPQAGNTEFQTYSLTCQKKLTLS
jgi:hypothetical protein